MPVDQTWSCLQLQPDLTKVFFRFLVCKLMFGVSAARLTTSLLTNAQSVGQSAPLDLVGGHKSYDHISATTLILFLSLIFIFSFQLRCFSVQSTQRPGYLKWIFILSNSYWYYCEISYSYCCNNLLFLLLLLLLSLLLL